MKSYKASVILLTIAFTVSIVGTCLASAPTACTPNQPQDVLDCLRAIYAAKDSVAYGELLATDYVCCSHGTTWDRAQEIASAAAMFHNETIRSIKLTISEDFSVREDGAGGWELADVNCGVTFITTDGKQQSYQREGDAYFVRRAGDQLVIYRYETACTDPE